MGLNRLSEAKAICQKEIELKIDTTIDHRSLYNIAFHEGDAAGMQRQVEWAKGKPDEFIMLEAVAETAAYSGKLQKSREMYSQAIEGAQRRKLKEVAATITARSALSEARFGNLSQAREGAAAAIALDRTRATSPFAAAAFALAGDASHATALADELEKNSAKDTWINNVTLPMVRAMIEISRSNPAKAIELLRPVSVYDFGLEARVLSAYFRGIAYLKAKRGQEAAVEFQRVIDHIGVCSTSPYCAMARLQLGRAKVLSGDNAGGRAAYQDFLAIWKDADPDTPVLKEAKAEYARIAN
jgi:tetratricopeptide (TPR) repeat protein